MFTSNNSLPLAQSKANQQNNPPGRIVLLSDNFYNDYLPKAVFMVCNKMSL